MEYTRKQELAKARKEKWKAKQKALTPEGKFKCEECGQVFNTFEELLA